jgi:hypothetical protein
VTCRVAVWVVVEALGLGEWEVRPLAAEEVDRVGVVLGLARLDRRDGFYLVAWERDTPVGHAYLALLRRRNPVQKTCIPISKRLLDTVSELLKFRRSPHFDPFLPSDCHHTLIPTAHEIEGRCCR